MTDKDWIILGDEPSIRHFLPDLEPPEGLRVLVGEIDFHWPGPTPPTPPPPPTITAYSQRDPRWKDDHYTPGWTFGAAGCLVVAYTMILSLGGYTDDPPTVARRLTEIVPGMFHNGELVKPHVIQDLYGQMEWAGKLDWTNVAADMDAVVRALDHGPTIMQVDFIPGGRLNTHFVVATALTADADDVFIIDPWDGATTKLLERYALDDWNLARAIYGLRLLRVSKH